MNDDILAAMARLRHEVAMVSIDEEPGTPAYGFITDIRIVLDALETAQADTRRLEWLDKNWNDSFVCKNELGYLPWREGFDYQPTLRVAIDAVMKDKT